ncbi:MAG: hypothetical protein ISS23_02635 [Nanoarchaeota archaeon]|nr:hypothetical protein [Nanoarchaeota archaeon]
MKKIIALIIIITLLFSFGCLKKSGNGTTTSGAGFQFTGQNGIVAEFDEDAPPKINFVAEPIELKLKITNRGVKDLSPGEIQAKLTGVAATEIFSPTTTETSNEDELLAAELDPSTTIIDLGLITYLAGSAEEMVSAEYKPEIKAEICFPYQTKANINEFWIGQKQKNLDKGTIASKENSAAPVQISNLAEFKGTNKVNFNFWVKNVGKGKVVSECFPEERSDETVEIEIVQPRGVDCDTLGGGSSGTIKLGEKGRVVRCSVTPEQKDDYKTPLVIKLDYNYDLKLEKDITIRRTDLII